MLLDINFPVIILPKNGSMIYVYASKKHLTSSSEELLEVFDKKAIELIDNTGSIFCIRRAFKVKYLGLWGFNPFLKGRQILIDFEFDPEVKNILLDDLKNEVTKRVDKNRSLWQSSWSIRDLEQQISQCSSFKEIAELLK